MSLLALVACGGGSGGGGSRIDAGTIDIPGSVPGYTVNDIETRRANVNVSSMIDNGTKREEHIAKMYAAAGIDVPINDNGSLNVNLGRNGSSKHKTGISNGASDLFANMHEWCSGEKMADFYNLFPDNMTEDEINNMLANTSNLQGLMNSLRHALVLAGYGLEIKNQGNHYVIHLIKDHENEIKEQANEIWNQMGQFQEFDITRAELAADGDTIHFILNDNNKIDGILYTENAGQENRDVEYTLTKQENADHTYTMNFVEYVYGIHDAAKIFDENGNVVHNYEPTYSHDIKIETNKSLTLQEIKARLLAQIEFLYEDQKWFHEFHSLQDSDITEATEQCLGCTEDEIKDKAQDIAARKMYDMACARVNALTETDIQSDNFIHTVSQPINITINLETYGKDVGLAFADFGKMYLYSDDQDDENDDVASQAIYGGYSDKLIAPDNFANNDKKTFTGKMFGKVNVTYSQNGENGGLVNKLDDLALIDNNAKLVFNHNNNVNTETLTASFDNWYDMEMTKTGNTANLAFTNYKHKDANNNINNDYRFLGDTPNNNDNYNNSYNVNNFTQTKVTNFIGTDQSPTGNTSGYVDIQYYGNDNIPSETVGFVSYAENEPINEPVNNQPVAPEDDLLKHVGFQVGFGMTKDYIEH